jgi:hypothetical protein
MTPNAYKRLVQSIQFGIAIEQGHSAVSILEAMTDGDTRNLPPPPDQTGRQRPAMRALKLSLLHFRMFTGARS